MTLIAALVGLVLLGLAGAIYRCRQSQTPPIDALRRAARALGGTVTRAPDGTFQLDAFVAGQSVHLGYQTVFSCGVRRELYAEVVVDDHESQLDVHPRTSEPHPPHNAALTDTPSGDYSFDAAYHVLSSGDRPTPRLLPPEARQLMIDAGPVLVRVAAGRLEVRRPNADIDAPTVLNLARIAGLSARAYVAPMFAKRSPAVG